MEAVKGIVLKIAQIKKDSYTYNLIKGVLHYEEADYNIAKKFFEKAMKMNEKNDSKVFYYFGKLLFDQQKYKESSNILSKAVKIELNNLDYKIALLIYLILYNN